MYFANAPTFVELNVSGWHWALLLGWFGALLLIDLFIFHRTDHETSLKSALRQSAVWIGLGIGLGIVFFVAYGRQAGVEYFSGYLIEKSLSIDNVFAWSVVMAYYAIPKKYQHRVLFWGIFGALFMRAVFIFAGIEAIQHLEAILIVFGLILLYSGYKLLATKEGGEFNPERSHLVRWMRRIIPVSHELDGHKFFTVENGKRVATILFIALITIEITDAIFAVDSVPAILAVARDPFIVFASNAAAILGLRSLYFVFEKVKQKFWLLNEALGILLLGIGVKMIISPDKIFGVSWLGFHIPTGLSLIGIALTMSLGVTLSLLIQPPVSRATSQK